jgi:hypothetical protein
MQQQQVLQQQVLQQQQVNAWIGGSGPNHLALSTPPNSRPLDTGAFGDAIARNRAFYNQHNAQGAQGLQQGPRIANIIYISWLMQTTQQHAARYQPRPGCCCTGASPFGPPGHCKKYARERCLVSTRYNCPQYPTLSEPPSIACNHSVSRHQIESPKRAPKESAREAGYRSRICLNKRRNTNLARETRTLCPVGRTSLSPWV